MATANLLEQDLQAIHEAHAAAEEALARDLPSVCTDRPSVQVADGDLASLVDQCVLSPLATLDDLREACDLVRRLNLHGVCVNSYYAETAADLLEGTTRAIVATVSFPLGSTPTAVKEREAELAARVGATEIDLVPRLGLLREKNLRGFFNDIRRVVVTQPLPVRVALEMGMLTDTYERALGAILSEAAGAKAVKTSTGFPYDLSREYSPGSAEQREKDVEILAAAVSPAIGIKVAGGIRTHSHAMRFVVCGATRIGTSAAARLVARGTAELPPTIAT